MKKGPKSEIYFFGQIVGATAITEGDGIFVEAFFEQGNGWDLLEGQRSFQTQTSYVNDDDFACFSHPFQIKFETTNCFQWPRMVVQVWKLDETDTIDLYSYGVLTLPSSPGYHELKFHTWSIHGNLKRELLGFFLDSKPVMSSAAPISKEASIRENLLTKPGPEITVAVEVVMRGFSPADLRKMMSDKTNITQEEFEDLKDEEEEKIDGNANEDPNKEL